ncbi:riboflavin synthase [Azospirillum baldaniorum]|uniref:Riboflavin synthase n=4 Tax=Azospirillum TaxID=191 RepID=A0A6L3B787_AZOBR|nr:MULTISPECIES: riboflavin synthase [Azospirillum]AIB11550.1 riboflavin synthase subunit alpha [Azospirillum argentinense]AWJ89700.1 riboflavin synthase [Azospirillum baldaniorum]EZQ08462.1 riboflavin synthase subunit alpha [Azospirillum argentinense]KAA0688887.1 riboflavin synthase [Azospirillum brasilense]KAA1058877.1 Riboflavin synthase eubacterial/eukaryotic [Azospirillum argentinense]
MFTGIITDVGRVRAVERQGDTRFTVETVFAMETVPIGASIANNGVCLTVVEKGPGWFAVQASAETLSKTTLGGWAEGTRINLERALKVGDELGGHIVSGHVDGVATVVEVRADGESKRFTFEAPATLAKYIASKGSVALDGVSLTVNEVDGARFGVNIIPHTQDATTFGALKAGDRVNLEIDMLARYVARLAGQE